MRRYVISIVQKAKYENQKRVFRENTSKESERSGDDNDFCRKKNAFEMRYSGLLGRKRLNGLDQSDLFMRNVVGSSKFEEFLNRDIC